MKPTVVSWTAIVAAWGVLLAGAAGVMKITDAVHSWTETHLPKIKFPPYSWIVVACGAGVVTCLTSHLNPFTSLFPSLGHTYGEVLSGIALGGIASPGHHLTALIAAKSNAVVPLPPDVPVDNGQATLEAAFGPSETPSEGLDGPTDPTAAPVEVAPPSDVPPMA